MWRLGILQDRYSHWSAKCHPIICAICAFSQMAAKPAWWQGSQIPLIPLPMSCYKQQFALSYLPHSCIPILVRHHVEHSPLTHWQFHWEKNINEGRYLMLSVGRRFVRFIYLNRSAYNKIVIYSTLLACETSVRHHRLECYQSSFNPTDQIKFISLHQRTPAWSLELQKADEQIQS